MIIDLNLKGNQVVVVGGGREATRKVDALLYQNCEINVIAERFSEEIISLDKDGKIFIKQGRVKDGGFLNDYNRLILLIAATDDKPLNREMVQAAKKLRCYAYAVDDPEVSDFNHPSVMNIGESVQVAISTGGKSPLMAKQLREKVEPVLNELINKEDDLKIQLQFRLREKIKTFLHTADKRKAFLEFILSNTEINQLLSEEKLNDAEKLSLSWLEKEDA